jgi:hypothetical protein
VARIFISYRRDDSGGWAGRLYDRISQHFGRDNVFMDIDLWGNYPYPRTAKAREGREDLQAPDDQARVLRGGTFLSNRRIVRCAYRHEGLPNTRH